jgi:hypothetical protein
MKTQLPNLYSIKIQFRKMYKYYVLIFFMSLKEAESIFLR